jgi:copper transport protein
VRARTWFSLLIAVLAIPASASAHAELTASDRGQDGQTRLVFSAPVEQEFLRVTTASGTAVQAGRDPQDDHVVRVGSTTAGEGLLAWRVLSRDGHVTSGQVDGTAEIVVTRTPRHVLTIASDALVFMALLGLFGLLVTRYGVIAPALRDGGSRPPGAGSAKLWQQAVAPSLRDAMRIWRRSWVCCVVGAGAGLVLAPIGVLAELGSRDVGGLAGTRWGQAWLVALAGLVLGAVVMVRYGNQGAEDDPGTGRSRALAAGGALVVTQIAIAWSGHAGSGTDAGIGVGLDAVHLAATGAWLGGLMGLVAVIPSTRRGVGTEDAIRLDAAIVVRFSTLAISCVGALVVTGVYRAIAELSSPDDLVDTGYGRVLLVKLILFVVLLVGGVYNRLVLHPRMERTALGLRDTDGGASRSLRTSVRAEIGLGAAVLVVVAILVNFPPP